jgi:two-component system, OmpR family, sensor kinase
MLRDISDMEDMIEATLSYLKGDEKSESPRAIDLIALMDTIVGNARDAGHTVDLIAPSHLVINARRIGLKRALANLIENATRYGTAVGVTVAAEADAIKITIEDNGPGIPEEQLATVLEPFVRLEASRNRETGGVGLGLTIAQSNIEANGGNILLRNRPTGGLCAIVTLPAAYP